MDTIYDLIIIGGGPAGLTAGLYGGRSSLKTLILEQGNIGGRAYETREIVNYPAIKNATGPDLMAKMAEQAQDFGVEIRHQKVRSVDLASPDKKIYVRNITYHARAVIVATGTHPRLLGIPGEAKFRGAGVSYCATCDAAFFEGEDVVVVGSGDQAIEESMFIARFARSVTIIVIHGEGVLDANRRAASAALAHPALRFVFNSTVSKVYGQEEVEGVTIKDIRTGATKKLACTGVFFFCGMVPETDFLADQVPRDAQGWLHTQDDMSLGVEGVFAAGDVRKKYLRQVATAVGDGAAAATAAQRYLDESKQLCHVLEVTQDIQDTPDKLGLEGVRATQDTPDTQCASDGQQVAVTREEHTLQEGQSLVLGFWDPYLPGSLEALEALRLTNTKKSSASTFIDCDVNLKPQITARYAITLDEEHKAYVICLEKGRVEKYTLSSQHRVMQDDKIVDP